jgi:hypothetical protein
VHRFDRHRRHHQLALTSFKKTGLRCRPFKNLARFVFLFFCNTKPNNIPLKCGRGRQHTTAIFGTGLFANLLAGFDFHSGRISKRDPITNRYNPQVRLMGISGFVLSCGEIRDGT